jgi:hypothetical protein
MCEGWICLAMLRGETKGGRVQELEFARHVGLGHLRGGGAEGPGE